MPKSKYYYDNEKLVYQKIVTSFGAKVRNFLLFVFATFLCGLIALIVLLNTSFIQTPKGLSLSRELKQYAIQFEILNKKMNQMESVMANIEERDNNIYRLYFESNPIPLAQRKAGFGGINRYRHLEGFDNSKIVINTTKRLEILQKQLVVQSKSLDEVANLAENKEKLLVSIPAIQPINNEDLTRMASGYGWRKDPFTKARKMHRGMDFTAPKGVPVYASGDGIIIRADNKSSGYGNHIRINHGYNYISLYAHLSKFNVKKGQRVKRGEVIGFVGSTGRSQAPHLHYEIFKGRKRINPINYYYGNLTSKEFDEMLKVANLENQSLD